MTLFVSGCTHRCKGCFNRDQWDFGYGEPFTREVEERIFEALEACYVAGLSILGGEPMEPENQRSLVPFLMRMRERFGDAKTLWVYTGCLIEELKNPASRWHTEATDQFLSMIDVLVDGPFVEELKDISLQFRGSSNQRILRLRGQEAEGPEG